MNHRILLVTTLASALFALVAVGDEPVRPGPTDKGFLLPNGWTITPAGKQVALTDLPLNIIPLTDGRHVLVATNGFNKHELSLIDLTTQTVVTSEAVRESCRMPCALSP